MALNPGDKVLLEYIDEQLTVTVQGNDYVHTERVGRVGHYRPGNGDPEFIGMRQRGSSYRWNGAVADYVVGVTSCDPALEARWEAE